MHTLGLVISPEERYLSPAMRRNGEKYRSGRNGRKWGDGEKRPDMFILRCCNLIACKP